MVVCHLITYPLGGGILPPPLKLWFYARACARARDRGCTLPGGETRPPGLSSVSPGGSDINALYALPSGTAAIVSLLKPIVSDAVRVLDGARAWSS